MKKVHFFSLVLVAVLLLPFIGCRTNYLVETRFNPNLSGTRTIYSADTNFDLSPGIRCRNMSPRVSLVVDFYDCIDTMRYARQQTFAHLLPLPKDADGNPVWKPKEKISKRFRWFYTYYDYTARYDKIKDVPMPLTNYLTPEQQQVLLRGETGPADWNGMEMYCQLDKLNVAFEHWQNACRFEVLFRACRTFATAEQQQMLDAYHDTLCRELEEMADVEQNAFLSCTDTIDNLKFCRQIFVSNQAAIKDSCDRQSVMFYYIGDAVMHRVYLPGTVVNSEGCTIADSNCCYKVDAFRLLAGDLNVAVTARTTNTWAILLTAIVLGIIAFFAFPRKKLSKQQ